MVVWWYGFGGGGRKTEKYYGWFLDDERVQCSTYFWSYFIYILDLKV